MDWHKLKKEEVIKHLNSNPSGLSNREAAKRLEEFGTNELKQIYKLNPLKIFFKQFKSFLIYILLAAIIVSLLIQHYIDAGVVFVIIILNATIGFMQQYKAEKSIIQLRQLFVPKAKVFRENKLHLIPSSQIVPGDIILFEEGDKILADCRILESENLEANEAILTGESNSVEKYDTLIIQDGTIAERINMLFTGTAVVRGKTKAIVVSTGMSTEFGKIALKLQEINLPETPMQKKLDKFAKQVSLVIIIIATITFLLGVLYGKDSFEMLLTSIALIVSAIPEGLPAVITISLALATKKMLLYNVLIRRLPAAETLGSVTVIASDKTGTLTEEKMHVSEIFYNNQFYSRKDGKIFFGKKPIDLYSEKGFYDLVKTGILSSNARFEEANGRYEIIGDPTEAALVSLALELGINRKILTEKEPRIKEISFSSERKMMSIVRSGQRRKILYSKGAPTSIITRLAFELKNNSLSKITEARKKQLLLAAESMEKQGYRVLAFAYKFLTTEKNLEEGLTFLGFMALLDPPRKEVKGAICSCINAGIKVKMITGDSLYTAKTVGKQIGIQGRAITGIELDDLSDEELLNQIENISIFARTEPKQKLRIVDLLMKKGEEVAITGDGVNDILALKRADIGIAMGKRGSDVARDVSDMILIDDNFASLVKGVEMGREVYDNSKKATKFLLASNAGEILIILLSIFLGLPVPLLPLQILWINLVTDSFPAFALTQEKPEDVMKSQPRKESSILNGIFKSVIFAGIVSLIFATIVFYYGLTNLNLEETRTMVMFSLIGFEMFFAFSCRSERSIFKLGFFSNKYMFYAISSTIILQLALIFTPLGDLFGIVSLSGFQWLLVFLTALPGFVVFEISKLLRKK